MQSWHTSFLLVSLSFGGSVVYLWIKCRVAISSCPFIVILIVVVWSLAPPVVLSGLACAHGLCSHSWEHSLFIKGQCWHHAFYLTRNSCRAFDSGPFLGPRKFIFIHYFMWHILFAYGSIPLFVIILQDQEPCSYTTAPHKVTADEKCK